MSDAQERIAELQLEVSELRAEIAGLLARIREIRAEMASTARRERDAAKLLVMDRNREIFVMRETGATFKAIGEYFGISDTRAREIHGRIWRRMERARREQERLAGPAEEGGSKQWEIS